MLGGMEYAEKVAFMQSMMGACIANMTEGLDAEQRTQLAESVLGGMRDELRRGSEVA